MKLTTLVTALALSGLVIPAAMAKGTRGRAASPKSEKTAKSVKKMGAGHSESRKSKAKPDSEA